MTDPTIVIELDRYVFHSKVVGIMCAQVNNEAPVRFSIETSSCDMPPGYVQLLLLQCC